MLLVWLGWGSVATMGPRCGYGSTTGRLGIEAHCNGDLCTRHVAGQTSLCRVRTSLPGLPVVVWRASTEPDRLA